MLQVCPASLAGDVPPAASALRKQLVQAAEVILTSAWSWCRGKCCVCPPGTCGLCGAAGLLPPRAPLGSPLVPSFAVASEGGHTWPNCAGVVVLMLKGTSCTGVKGQHGQCSRERTLGVCCTRGGYFTRSPPPPPLSLQPCSFKYVLIMAA